jgi:O-antigen ligase
MTLALPIALVRILHSQRWIPRIVYGMAVCALIAATFATYRKSGIIGPVSVVLTLAYFRRRELLKLAPLGMVLLIIVSAISPGALGSTVRQFTRSDAAAVPTVSDRSSDYDAVRPDVWSHLALGRGWGSYNHDSYRILDSEILSRTIETGVIGLFAFLMLGVTVVLTSRKTIDSRDPDSAPVALIGASIAVAFLVLATLFDSLSFPHVAYIFLYMVGLETVVLEKRRRPVEPPPPDPPDDLPEDFEDRPRISAQARLVPLR